MTFGAFGRMLCISAIMALVVVAASRLLEYKPTPVSSAPTLTLLDTNGSTNEFIWMPDDPWKDATLLIHSGSTSTNGFDSNFVIAVRYKPIVEDKTSNGFWIIRFK